VGIGSEGTNLIFGADRLLEPLNLGITKTNLRLRIFISLSIKLSSKL